jgi:hypothetical protein
MTEPRSWLFVPADSERKIARALESEADAVIFDLEDSVAPGRKAAARDILKGLPKRSNGPEWWVRVNPLGSEFHKDDLTLIGSAYVHGIVLPKAETGADVTELAHRTGNIPIHAIVTETAASLFGLLSYRDPKSPLAAMSWGAEDLSAALGASSKYDAGGNLSFTYKLARSLCLAGAVADRAAHERLRPGVQARRGRGGAARRLYRQARDPPGPGADHQFRVHALAGRNPPRRGNRRRVRGASRRRRVVGWRQNGRSPAPRASQARA